MYQIFQKWYSLYTCIKFFKYTCIKFFKYTCIKFFKKKFSNIHVSNFSKMVFIFSRVHDDQFDHLYLIDMRACSIYIKYLYIYIYMCQLFQKIVGIYSSVRDDPFDYSNLYWHTCIHSITESMCMYVSMFSKYVCIHSIVRDERFKYFCMYWHTCMYSITYSMYVFVSEKIDMYAYIIATHCNTLQHIWLKIDLYAYIVVCTRISPTIPTNISYVHVFIYIIYTHIYVSNDVIYIYIWIRT